MPATGDRITKRKDGLFQGMYTAQTPDGPARKYIYGRKKKDVERRLAEAMGDAARGIVFDAGTLTVGQWLDSWLSDSLKPLVDAGKMTYSTYKRYAGIVRKHLKPALGHRKLKDVTRAEVRKLYASKGETLSPRSVDYIHVTLQTALSRAVRDDLIARNVAEGERPRSSRDRRSDDVKALSPAQVRALLDAARGTRNEALYIVALHTGLRQGELLGLKWSDVGAANVTVRRSLKVTDHGLDFGPTKNKASRRSVPLNRTAAAVLGAHKARQSEERIAARVWHDVGLVFPNRVGKPADHNNLYYREYKPLLERAGLEGEGFTFHALRHTFASALFVRGEHPKRVQSLLGHSS